MNFQDEVINRISNLLNEQKKTPRDLLQYLGLGKGMFSHWKNDNRKTYYQYIPEIAHYLNTTPNYLLLGKVEPMEISTYENETVQMFRKLSDNQKEIIRTLMKDLVKV